MNEFDLVRELKLYKKMYYHLFNKVSDVIELCSDERIKDILINAEQETEEIYMNS